MFERTNTQQLSLYQPDRDDLQPALPIRHPKAKTYLTRNPASNNSNQIVTWFPLQSTSSIPRNPTTQYNSVPKQSRAVQIDYSIDNLSDTSDQEHSLFVPEKRAIIHPRKAYVDPAIYSTPVKSSKDQAAFKKASLTQIMKKTNTYYSEHSFNYADIQYSSDSDTADEYPRLPMPTQQDRPSGLLRNPPKPFTKKILTPPVEEVDESSEFLLEQVPSDQTRSPSNGNKKGSKKQMINEMIQLYNECAKNNNEILDLLSQITTDVCFVLLSYSLGSRTSIAFRSHQIIC